MSYKDKTEHYIQHEAHDASKYYDETILVGNTDEDGLVSLFGADEIPAVIGQYRILERIGQGGMGTIYKAEHVHLKRKVALKVIRESRLNDAAAEEWFKFETQVMGQLQHPNIVHTTDAGVDQGRRFLVMELLDGNDLTQYVKENGPLDLEDALTYLKQAAIALGFAHLFGIVHRDVKPSNIFLTEEGRIKLLDLGLAQCMCKGAKEETAVEGIAGSPSFMSPEQISGKPVDVRSDLYSLGCTLYFMLTGKMPFNTPRHKNIHSVFRAHLYETLPGIGLLRHGIPKSVERLFERMTAKRPEDRFQTMYELVDAIDDTGLVDTAVSSQAVRRKRARSMAVLSVVVTPLVLMLSVHLSQSHSSTHFHSSENDHEYVNLTSKPDEPQSSAPREKYASNGALIICPPELHADCLNSQPDGKGCTTDHAKGICLCPSSGFREHI